MIPSNDYMCCDCYMPTKKTLFLTTPWNDTITINGNAAVGYYSGCSTYFSPTDVDDGRCLAIKTSGTIAVCVSYTCNQSIIVQAPYVFWFGSKALDPKSTFNCTAPNCQFLVKGCNALSFVDGVTMNVIPNIISCDPFYAVMSYTLQSGIFSFMNGTYILSE